MYQTDESCSRPADVGQCPCWTETGRDRCPDLTPELRKAAAWVLENPERGRRQSVRRSPTAAAVKPNTLVRLARAVGFDGFDELPRPYREDVAAPGRESFPRPGALAAVEPRPRRRWTGSMRGSRRAPLIANIESALFAETESSHGSEGGGRCGSSRRGALTCWGSAVSPTPGAQLRLSRRHGAGYGRRHPARGQRCPPTIWRRAGPEDVLLAMTFKPYRREVVEAVAAAARAARRTESSRSPTARLTDPADAAAHRFIVPTETPQAFTSTIALGGVPRDADGLRDRRCRPAARSEYRAVPRPPPPAGHLLGGGAPGDDRRCQDVEP